MTRHVRPLFELAAALLTLAAGSMTARAQQAASDRIGEFTARHDVGHPSIAGSASYVEKTGAYTLTGSGANIWAERDAFHYATRPMKGDFILTARGKLLGKGVDPHRKFGWMIRSTLDSNSAHVSAVVHGDGLTSLQFRRTAGAITEQVVAPMSGADVFQLERRGTTYIMSTAKFGDTLTAVQTTDITLGDSVLVGLFICAHNDTVVERASFTDVRITVPARVGFVPYREYIGSNIEILDVTTGNRRIIYRSPASVQAPNWAKDGKSLIYNEGGKLYRFDLASGTPTLINTGSAIGNNNDHVLSFDGKMLGISSSSAESGNRSIVYTLPASGGTPTRITQNGPSYLHGWSPDGRTLVFTGIRDSATDIYAIPSRGGEERRLTREAMNDGSEYGPDGRIYFNSTRSGLMQLWRMNSDGGAPKQLTDDPFNNWFPHVSPNGRTIVYIAFMKDVRPTDHPWYKPVYLRRMPVGGGKSTVLAYVYGGQGTINVPSWSPDGRYVAFVSNTDKY
ncbi:MAG: biopolymer transporter TolR [Gemmatimonadaceae bacterium]